MIIEMRTYKTKPRRRSEFVEIFHLTHTYTGAGFPMCLTLNPRHRLFPVNSVRQQVVG